MAEHRKLTKKQKRFADEYIISGNLTQSAIKAGYSERTAATIGSENIRKPNIKRYIDERLEELEASKYLSMEEALQITAAIARGEPRRIKEYDHELDMEFSKDIYPDFKDQKGALEHFFKIQGAFLDRVEHTGSMSVNDPFKDLTTDELRKLADRD